MKESLSVIIPALNEEKMLPSVLDKLSRQLEESGLEWEMLLVNDGSSDDTGSIMSGRAQKDGRFRIITHGKPEGIGKAYSDGAKLASKALVTWVPADGENDLAEHIEVVSSGAGGDFDILVPYVVNKNVRQLSRRIVSFVFLFLVRIFFGYRFRYTNGNSIYKREVLNRVLPESRGFFFQAEMLVRAVSAGYTYMEFPIHLSPRGAGKSKALKLKSFIEVARGFLKLFYRIKIKKYPVKPAV